MKYFALIVIIFLSFNIQSKEIKNSKWKKYYSLVLKDIKSVEKIQNPDVSLRIRLFELYGEKLQLLLQKENEYRINYLNGGKSKSIKGVLKKQKATLRQLEKIAKKIEKATSDRQVLAKINYYRSMNFSLVKDTKKFYTYIKKAESLNTDKNLGYNINLKLADHYYNEKNFSRSTIYYNKVLKQKKDQWATKNHYNLAWSYLKLEKYSKAIFHIKKTYSYEKQEGFFQIGEQLVDSILLFYAFANQTKKGLAFLNSKNQINFENLIKYMQYIYKSGDKKTLPLVINEIEKIERNEQQEFLLTVELIEVYRGIKKYGSLQKHLLSFNKKVSGKEKKVNKEIKEKLISSLKSYTGLLQKTVVKQQNKNRYLGYISFNFNLLKKIDRANQLEYSYYTGESYFQLYKFKRAGQIYLGALRVNKNQNRKSKFLDKSFDSLFKVIEKTKKLKGKFLVKTFKTYLYYYPREKKANAIYKRLIGYYRSVGADNKMFKTLIRYNKNFPSETKAQKRFYSELVDKFIRKRNLPLVSKLKKYVDKGFLGYTKTESLKLKKIMNEIYFSKYEDMAKKGDFRAAIAGFQLLFEDKKTEYELRVDSLRKKMFYQNKIYDYVGLSGSLSVANKFFKKRIKKKFSEEIKYYIQNICVGDQPIQCVGLYEAFEKAKVFTFPKELATLKFKIKLSFMPLKIKNLPRDTELQNYLFKVLMADSKKFTHPLFTKFYKQKEKKDIIDLEVETRVLQYFYRSLNINETIKYVNSLGIPSLKSKFLKIFNVTKSILDTSSISLPATPKKPELTEESFGALGNGVMQAAENNTTMFQMAIKKSHPNFLPFILSKLILRLENVTDRFKKFIPISKNPDLEKAMNDEMANIHKYFDNQIVEYRNLYFRAVSATMLNSGARFYNNDIINSKKTFSLNEIMLWENY